MSQTVKVKFSLIEVFGLTENDDPEGIEISLSDELLLAHATACAVFGSVQQEFAKAVRATWGRCAVSQTIPDTVKDRILQRSNEIGELAYCKLIDLAESVLSVAPELSDDELLRVIGAAGVREERGVSGHHHEAGHHLAHCKECDRFFDVRSGCPGDIREDERNRAVKLAEEMVGKAPPALGLGNVYNKMRHASEGWNAALREFARRLKEGR